VGLPTYPHTRLTIIRISDSSADTRPTPAVTRHLLDSLTPRDIAILTALDAHRYLDRNHIQQLFFTGSRTSQQRIRWLVDRHLVRRWIALESPGWRRRDSVLLLSGRGARILALTRGEDPAAAVRRSLGARDHSVFLVHDLEANGFFTGLARVSAPIEGVGLYHWVGQARCRERFLQSDGDVAPDGWGRYLTPVGEVTFMLEWDRATESANRVRAKFGGYVRCFGGDPMAHLSHILVVAPTLARELMLRDAIVSVLPRSPSAACCRFWTTNLELLREQRALGPIWSDTGAVRIGLQGLAKRPRSDRPASDCIAKPAWWTRRPAGGEGA
jgi:hypothetical protein